VEQKLLGRLGFWKDSSCDIVCVGFACELLLLQAFTYPEPQLYSESQCFPVYAKIMLYSTPRASKVHCSINGLENSSSPKYSKVQHLFGIAVGLFSAGVGLFSATVGLRKSPPPTKKSPTPIEKSPPLAKKSPTPIEKSPTLTQKSPTLTEKILLEKSPSPTKESPTPMRKSPVAHTRNILRSSEYIFTHVLLDFGIF